MRILKVRPTNDHEDVFEDSCVTIPVLALLISTADKRLQASDPRVVKFGFHYARCPESGVSRL